MASNATVQGIATNGTDVWIVDSKSDKMYKYTGGDSRISGSQNAASSFYLNGSNSSPTDIVTDGTSFWVLNDTFSTDKVFKYSLSGSLIGIWTILTPGVSSPTGITLNPASPSELWIVDKTTDRVYQYNAAVGVIFKASDIALIQLSDDFVRSRVGKPFERERADSEPSLAPPQSRNNVVSFSTQRFMQPARSENRVSSQAVPRDTLLSVLKAQGARTLAAQV